MKVRNLTENDYPQIVDIFHKVFERHEDYAFERAWLHKNLSLSVLAEEEKRVCGFLLVSSTHLEFLGVDPDYQGNRIGTTLLHSLLDKCKRRLVSLTLVPSNNSPQLISWYVRNGFRPLGYRDKELWMELIFE